MSDAMYNQLGMNDPQLAKYRAFQGRLAKRKEETLLAKEVRRLQEEGRKKQQQPDPTQSPLMAYLAQRDPQAAMQLAIQSQGQRSQTELQKAMMGQRAADTAADRALRERELTSTIGLNEAKQSALQQSLSPEQQRMDQMLSLANSPALSGNSQLQKQVGLTLAQAAGLEPIPNAIPESLQRPFNEDGTLDHDKLLDRAMFEFEDSGKTPEQALNALIDAGVSPDELRQLAMDETNGIAGDLGDLFSVAFSSAIGKGGDKRGEQIRHRKVVGKLRKALGMKVPAGYADGKGIEPPKDLMEAAFGSP